MSEATIAALVGIGTALLLRILDALLPKGWHFKWVHHWAEPDDPDDPDAG